MEQLDILQRVFGALTDAAISAESDVTAEDVENATKSCCHCWPVVCLTRFAPKLSTLCEINLEFVETWNWLTR